MFARLMFICKAPLFVISYIHRHTFSLHNITYFSLHFAFKIIFLNFSGLPLVKHQVNTEVTQSFVTRLVAVPTQIKLYHSMKQEMVRSLNQHFPRVT